MLKRNPLQHNPCAAGIANLLVEGVTSLGQSLAGRSIKRICHHFFQPTQSVLRVFGIGFYEPGPGCHERFGYACWWSLAACPGLFVCPTTQSNVAASAPSSKHWKAALWTASALGTVTFIILMYNQPGITDNSTSLPAESTTILPKETTILPKEDLPICHEQGEDYFKCLAWLKNLRETAQRATMPPASYLYRTSDILA